MVQSKCLLLINIIIDSSSSFLPTIWSDHPCPQLSQISHILTYTRPPHKFSIISLHLFFGLLPHFLSTYIPCTNLSVSVSSLLKICLSRLNLFYYSSLLNIFVYYWSHSYTYYPLYIYVL